MTTARAGSVLALAMVSGVFAVNVYRAATQSLTCDEAYTYELYWHGPLKQVFFPYDANNHVLNTLLERLTVRVFGLSEIAFRLPSLFGGALYLFFVLRLCRYAFGNRWTAALGVAALTLNPFVIDYLSAARGYGLGLGLFFAALYFAAAQPGRTEASSLVVGILLGLANSACLVFLFPSVALAAALTLMSVIEPKGIRRAEQVVKTVWFPMAAVSALFLAIPLWHATRDSFYYGEPTLRRAAFSLVQRSFFHNDDLWGGSWTVEVDRTKDFMVDWGVPILLLAILLSLLPIGLRRFRDLKLSKGRDYLYFLATATIGLSMAELVIAHWAAQLLYPSGRTGIYFVPLVTFAWIVLIDRALASRWPFRALAAGATLLTLLGLASFLCGFTVNYYYEWRYDAGSKRIFSLLRQEHLKTPWKRVRLGVEARLEPSCSFYRDKYHLEWMEPVTMEPPETGAFDHYILTPRKEAVMQSLHLRAIYRDSVSSEILAVP